MNIFNIFKKKKKINKENKYIAETTNSINNTEDKTQSISPIGILPEYSDRVPPHFDYNKELEFLNYINNRTVGDLSYYETSRFKDYKNIISQFSDKGYLEYNHKKNLEAFKVSELKDILKDNDLKRTGNKVELIERVYENIDEENIKSNYDYKEKYSISQIANNVLSKYHIEKNIYNNNRDEIIYQEEFKKDNPHFTTLIQFEDLNNTDEFKRELSKTILLTELRGERYEYNLENFTEKRDERFNCPKFDDFLDSRQYRPRKQSSDYIEKLRLYVTYELNKIKYLDLKGKYLEFYSSNASLRINPTPGYSVCPTEKQDYYQEDFINDTVPEFPHHYGCMCWASISSNIAKKHDK